MLVNHTFLVRFDGIQCIRQVWSSHGFKVWQDIQSCSQEEIPIGGIEVEKTKTGINKIKIEKLNILCDIYDTGQTFKTFRRICRTYWRMERLGSSH